MRVNTLHPGPTSTSFQDDIEVRFHRPPVQEANAVFDRMIPFGRHCTPEEIANAVLFLASDDSAMMSATLFAVDGGMG